MKIRTFLIAGVLAFGGGAASAATLNGTFNVSICNVIGVDSASSQATLANYDACMAGELGDDFSVDNEVDYTGDIHFGTFDASDATTIADWLNTGSNPGTVTGLALDTQQSAPNINTGDAVTSFFVFTTDMMVPEVRKVIHDDGFALFRDGVQVAGFLGPVAQTTTMVNTDVSGAFKLLYVATNGDPSVLKVEVVPLPAAGWMLLAGLGGLAAIKRRGKAA